MASLKAAMKSGQKEHRERSQLAGRKHLGMLEKHSDYVKRARNYHKKETLLKSLRKKASERNPDEFYFKMVNTKTRGGVHVAKSQTAKTYTAAQIKLLKTQDLNYLNYKCNAEAKKVQRMQETLHMIDTVDAQKRSHTFFFDTPQEAREFDPAKQFDTVPEMLDRTHNIPTMKTLQQVSFTSSTGSRPAAARYQELEERIKRESELNQTRDALALQRNLMGKGCVSKKKNASGGAVYKWKKQRKR